MTARCISALRVKTDIEIILRDLCLVTIADIECRPVRLAGIRFSTVE
jgi:hypothetical protein